MIDEKKLIEDLNKWLEVITKYCNKFNYHDALERYEEAYYIFADIIDEQPKLSLETKTSDKWIPCSERLPEDEGDYLVTCKGEHNRFVEIVQFRFGRFMICLDLCEVIAWYDEPLPKAYKGDKL